MDAPVSHPSSMNIEETSRPAGTDAMAQAHIPTSIAPLDSAAISAVLSANADLRLAILFGSAAAGRLGATSDVDMAGKGDRFIFWT
ncbi:MAG: nucleotidyltransferase domain-containing protein [Gammaproteobacteria bacterium]|nr:nucleotidyltransferase domain-containing protein [Gammaproteobacteria bacterium]